MIRLLIADDHRIFREGLARMLRDNDDFEVVAEAGRYCDVMDALRSRHVDLAILDLSMPGRDSAEAISHVKDLQPMVKILVIKMPSDDTSAVRDLRAGADGYMTTQSAVDEVAGAIRQIARGFRYVCPTVAARLALGMADGTDRNKAYESLSSRELKILEMLVAGKRGVEIASEFSLSGKTVSSHKTNLLRKLGLRSTSELIRYAMRHEPAAD